ncbi:hypothetical protein DC522_22410 [Microvirga sp. KLBC 81]|uniref:hypothetical protein n=1 Tax=Microvirga sp. KLBC 81 TaxID=1862707 RepID=UPI000D511E6E|nr:hypothetical protein [Microvirga sp. KLBC 81]PVE22164.1 hypothetical protein DC522_22410 [Microvirga sp. KLBC 81]
MSLKTGALLPGVAMLLELTKEQLRVLRRALEARARDMHMRLGSEPGDEGFRREAMLATQLLRQVEALERRADRRVWDMGGVESLPEEDET